MTREFGMLNNLLREIIPLTPGDCFTIFTRVKSDFDFPLHSHEEIELNFIHNGKGAKRIIGDHISVIDDYELVMIGPNLPHMWETFEFGGKEMTEVTIQFHKDFLDDRFLNRNQMSCMRKMMELSSRGILFSKETVQKIMPRILDLNKKQGFDSVLELLSVLHDLSISKNMQTLSDNIFFNQESYNSRRIQRVMEYVNHNFHQNISLGEVAKLVNMTEMSFSRFFKRRTGITFMDSLLECRLGNACRMLIDTTQSVSEIAYHCGFNNISNFNRLFKKRKGCTPKEFRHDYNFYGNRKFI
ncbi:AraC family transcriptional regulator [Elizabethkingia anophelis]|uniref:AraC family transcriptional regulator n=1 Tax=Elizabethkingia anophelis TaxID=1117645 RepID=UPI000B293697|nr:AraC family transcriptional regulator [Elizabethkingia anophelis]MDC8025093.1 AraC family transcriptional regulator [Elizabethkingia anophelis]